MRIITIAVILLAASPSLAAESPAAKGSIVVTSPWLRATPRGTPVAGGYATVTNKGPAADRLIGASLPMAPNGEVHAMSMTSDGVMHMKSLPDGLAIGPGASVTLSPGGYHLMFAKPSAPLKEGEHVKGELTFSKAGRVPVTFAVGGMAATRSPDVGTHGDTGADMPGMDMSGSAPKGRP